VSGVEGKLAVGRRVDIGEGKLGPWDVRRRIEHAEAETRLEEAPDGAVDVVAGDEAILESDVENSVLRAAGEVGAGFEGESGGLLEGHDEAVALIEVIDGPAVGDDVAFEAPLVAEKIVEKMVGAGGLAANGVVGAHDGIGMAVDDSRAEGRRVGVIEIVEGNRNIEAVTENFGAAVNGVVLGSGDR
jgi:hypothetical protein